MDALWQGGRLLSLSVGGFLADRYGIAVVYCRRCAARVSSHGRLGRAKLSRCSELEDVEQRRGRARRRRRRGRPGRGTRRSTPGAGERVRRQLALAPRAIDEDFDIGAVAGLRHVELGHGKTVTAAADGDREGSLGRGFAQEEPWVSRCPALRTSHFPEPSPPILERRSRLRLDTEETMTGRSLPGGDGAACASIAAK